MQWATALKRPVAPWAAPALPIAVALAAGATAAQFAQPGPGILLAVATLALIVALPMLVILGARLRPSGGVGRVVAAFSDGLILVAFVMAGGAGARLQGDFYSGSFIGSFATTEPRLAEVELTVASPPKLTAGSDLAAPGRIAPPRQSALGQVQRVRTTQGWQPASGKVRIEIAEPDPRLTQGQRIWAIGLFDRPGPVMTPGQTDWASIDRRQRIAGTLRVGRAGDVRILAAPPPPLLAPLDWLRQRTRWLLAEGFAANAKPQLATLQMLLLGDSDTDARDLRDDLTRNGVTHLIATSGLHVLILALLLRWVLRLLLVRPAVSLWSVVAFAAIYAAVVTPSPGAQRSAVAAGVVALAGLAGRRVAAIQILSLAVIVLLVAQPNEIATPGFQLGIVIVAGLILYAGYERPLDEGELLEMRAAQIARQIGRVRPGPVWRTRLARIGRPVMETARLAIIAWLIALPLVAFHFSALNPWSIAVGLVLLPLAVLALVAATGKILLTLLLPSLAAAWASGAVRACDWLRHAAHFAAGLGRAQVQVRMPSVTVVVIALLLVLLPPLLAHLPGVLRAAWGRVPPRFRRRAVWLGPIAGVGLVVLPALASRAPLAPGLRLTLLSVGDGQCAVVQAPGAMRVIIDAGGGADVAREVIEPFLRDQQITGIGTLILSRATPGYSSGASDLADVERPRALLVGPDFTRLAQFDPAARQMADALADRGLAPVTLRAGQTQRLGEATLSVLWPPGDRRTRIGDDSLVLRITYAGRSVLFTGDIGEGPMGLLLDRRDRLASDVLIAPQNGGSCEHTHDFVAAVLPDFILASSGAELDERQQKFDRLMVARRFWRTCNSGAITLTIAPGGAISVETFRP